MAERGWHNPKKQNDPTTEGKCPYCKKNVKALEKHIKDQHLEEKGAKEKIKQMVFAREKKVK